MTDLQTVKDRLFFFVESQEISVREFERTCGLSNGFVRNIRQSIQPDKLEKIVEHFPTLNKSWLMTGEGEMLRIDATSTPTGMMTEAQLRERIIALEKVIEEKDKRIAELQDGQEARINDLQEKVNTLAMAIAEAMRKDR